MAKPEQETNTGAEIAKAIIEKLQPWYNPTWLRTFHSCIVLDICGIIVKVYKENKPPENPFFVAMEDAWDNQHPEATRQHIEKVLNGWTRDDQGNLHPPANHATTA